jgi:hypothetical protein
MASEFGSRVLFNRLSNLASGDVVPGEWNLVTPFTIENAVRILVLQNFYNIPVSFAFSTLSEWAIGAYDPNIIPALVLPAGGQIVLDFTTNQTNISNGLFLPGNTLIFIGTDVAPTSGNVYATRISGV